MVHGPQQMPPDAKEILHDAVHGGEALQVRGRSKATHLAFPLAHRLMRHLGAIVLILIRAMDHRRHHRAARRRVTAELVRDQPARHAPFALQQRPEEPGGGAPTPSRLDWDVDDVTVLVDRSPQVLLATVQSNEQLIEMPRVSEAPAPVPQPAGIRAAERATPPADRLIGDRDAPLGQEVIDVTKTGYIRVSQRA